MTNQAQHTAGPWRRQVIAPDFKMTAIETSDGERSIARVYGKADARLISAAPELLEALELMVKKFGGVSSGRSLGQERALSEARAAIAKATGNA